MRPLPCLHMPEKGDPYFNTKSAGGYSPCALGNPAARVEGLNVLPNCVGYVVGAFNALGDYGCIKWLAARGNACDFVKIAHAQGLEVVPDPIPGGVMVWSGGKGGYGHVAFVEATKDGAAICSESEYYGKAWTLYTRRPGTDGQWRDGCYWMGSSYIYQGCIKNPFMEEDMTKAETEKLIWELVPKVIEQMEETTAKLPPDDWAKDSINMNIADGTMVGYNDGFHAQSKIRREEVSQIAANIKAWVKQYIQQIKD